MLKLCFMNFGPWRHSPRHSVLPAIAAQAQPAADTASIWTLQDENASISAGKPTDRLLRQRPAPRLDLADHGRSRTSWPISATPCGAAASSASPSTWRSRSTPRRTPPPSIPSPHDRPYAGVLLGNFSLLSDTEDTRSVLTLSLGVVGPGSGAEQLQNGFHDLIGQKHANGWDSQIQNTPAIELLHERTWRLPMGTVAGLETDALPSLTVGIGDLRDYIQTGVTFRFGQGLDSDFGVPRLRPGLSGGDAFTPTRPFAWYVFAGADGQAVAYDLLLQSTPFRGGPHVSTVWDVAEMQGGFAVMAYGMRLTFAYVAQTQEFHGQTGGLHQFGSASMSFRF